MKPTNRKSPHRDARNGVIALVAVATLIGTMLVAAHFPAAGEVNASRGDATPRGSPAAAGAASFVYFPSQYELHAGPPEEHIQAF